MKFSKLSTKFSKLLKKKEKGKKIKPDKLLKLQELLNQKKSKFEKRLNEDLSAEQRTSLESKLKVVSAQIAKTQALLSKDSDKSVDKDQPGEPVNIEQSAEPLSKA